MTCLRLAQGDAQRQKTASELNEAILGAQNQNPGAAEESVNVCRSALLGAHSLRELCSPRRAEPKLPLLIKMMLWAEKELAEKVRCGHGQTHTQRLLRAALPD